MRVVHIFPHAVDDVLNSSAFTWAHLEFSGQRLYTEETLDCESFLRRNIQLDVKRWCPGDNFIESVARFKLFCLLSWDTYHRLIGLRVEKEVTAIVTKWLGSKRREWKLDELPKIVVLSKSTASFLRRVKKYRKRVAYSFYKIKIRPGN